MKPTAKTALTTCLAIVAILKTGSDSAFPKESKTQAAPAKKTITALDEMQAKYKGVKSLTAEFTQKKTNLALGNTKESSGRIYIKRPNMFRWDTTAPDPSVLVSNGKKIWFYTPPFREGEKGQVMVHRASEQSQLAVDLLSGQADIKKEFKTKQMEPTRFELKPLKPQGDIERVELFLEKSTNLVYKLSLFTTTGNQTEMSLKNVELDVPLNEAMFNFKPPENTEEIR